VTPTVVHRREDRIEPVQTLSRDGVGRGEGRWRRWLMGVALLLMVLQGIGLACLAVLVKRSVDGFGQSQLALADRLVQTQEVLGRVTEDQGTLRLLVSDQQRNLVETMQAQQDWRTMVETGQRSMEARLASLESGLRTVMALQEEFGTRLSSAESTWKNVAVNLTAYRRQMDAVPAVVGGGGAAVAEQPDGVDRGPEARSMRLPRGVTSSGMLRAVR